MISSIWLTYSIYTYQPHRFRVFGEARMAGSNHGVGAEGLLAAQSALASDAELGNDGRVEHLWVLKAMGE